jgi:hypothetical protein
MVLWVGDVEKLKREVLNHVAMIRDGAFESLARSMLKSCMVANAREVAAIRARAPSPHIWYGRLFSMVARLLKL